MRSYTSFSVSIIVKREDVVVQITVWQNKNSNQSENETGIEFIFMYRTVSV